MKDNIMTHEQQCLEIMAKGLKGHPFFIVSISEGSWVDRAVASAMAYKLLGRPAQTQEEATKLETFFEGADTNKIAKALGGLPPIIPNQCHRKEFTMIRDCIYKLL